MKKLKDDILWRVGIVGIMMVVFAVIIIGQVVRIQFVQKDKFKPNDSTTLKNIEVIPVRGDIIDANGKVLVTNVPNYNVYLDFRADGLKPEIFRKNVDSLALCLSKIFPAKSKVQFKRDLTKGYSEGNRCKLIVKDVSFEQLKLMKKFPIFRLGQNRGGFIFKSDDNRARLFGDLASRTIGNINKGGTTVGIEGAFDSDLSGIKGIKLIDFSSNTASIQNEIDPVDGNDVISTIDINLQDVANNALRKQLIRQKANHGTAVLMEVETGEIKAIANLLRDTSGNCSEAYNYAIGESTEPGSTFKLASMMIALEDGFIDTSQIFDTQGGIFMNHGDTISDSHKGGYGRISVKQIFEKSSNAGVAKIIDKYYSNDPKRFVNRLMRLNLNERLGLQLSGEGYPVVHYPGEKNWWPGLLCSMSIGYSIRLTPLQLLVFYNAVANNGKMVRPKFVKALRYHGTIIKSFDTEIINPSICSKTTLEKLKKMLEGVVKYGTAKKLGDSCLFYTIAGKTGTARIAYGKSGYKLKSKINYQASFVGYFPAENPKYSCIVVINGPSNNVYYGGVVSAPVFKEIADRVYATSLEMHKDNLGPIPNNLDAPVTMNGYRGDLSFLFRDLNIPVKINSNSYWVVANKKEKKLELNTYNYKYNVVPNVVGMGLRDAIYLLEYQHLNVRVKGKGIVKTQSKSPGSFISKGDVITIELG